MFWRDDSPRYKVPHANAAASSGAYRLLRSVGVSHSMNPAKNCKYDVKSPEQLLNYWFQDNRGRDSVEDKWFKFGKLYDALKIEENVW